MTEPQLTNLKKTKVLFRVVAIILIGAIAFLLPTIIANLSAYYREIVC